MSRFDAVVLGGGPAGCATAMYAARAGLRVALLERLSFPRPKACGEGLMPAGVRVLDELGLGETVRALGRPFRGVRYTSRAGRGAEGRFPGAAAGLGVRREELDAALWRAAASHPNVEAVERRDDPGAFPAPLLAVCDGGRSRAAQRLGASRVEPARRRHGLSARFSGVAAGELVEVFLAPGAEIYVTPLSRGEALVAALFEQSALTASPERAYDEALRASPGLTRLLAGGRRATPLRGFGPLGGRAARVHGDGWLLAGDAAGALDPILGDGMAAALQTGRLAGQALAAAAQGDPAALAVYARRRAALLRPRRWLERAVLRAAARPSASEALIASLGAFPAAFDALLRLF